MSLTSEQKKQLNKLDNQYEKINTLSGKAGVNPDKLIDEFSDKFMDVSELSRHFVGEQNGVRFNTFQHNGLSIKKQNGL